VRVLREKGIIEELYLSYEQGGLGWILMHGESKEAIQQELETFPLHPYMLLEIVTLA
jgi:hypothetical protein